MKRIQADYVHQFSPKRLTTPNPIQPTPSKLEVTGMQNEAQKNRQDRNRHRERNHFWPTAEKLTNRRPALSPHADERMY